MKKLLLLSLISISLTAQTQKEIRFSANPFLQAREQSSPANPLYTFSTYIAAYTPINGTSLSGGLKWDDASFIVNMGFNFKLYSAQGSTINFAEGSFATFDNPNSSVVTLAAPMFEDLCDRAFVPMVDNEGDPGGISDISYTVTGTSGSRICVIQVKDAGFFGEIDTYSTSVSYVNFQLWLYEGTNDIEIRFGAVNIQNTANNLIHPNGFLCGLGEQVNLNTSSNISANVLGGPAANPSMTGFTGNEVVTGTVQSGTVYKFSRVNTSPVGLTTNEITQTIRMFPNPASNKLYFNAESEQDLKEARIYLYSLDGRLVSSKKVEQETDISEIAQGLYFIWVASIDGAALFSGKLEVTK